MESEIEKYNIAIVILVKLTVLFSILDESALFFWTLPYLLPTKIPLKKILELYPKGCKVR